MGCSDCSTNDNEKNENKKSNKEKKGKNLSDLGLSVSNIEKGKEFNDFLFSKKGIIKEDENKSIQGQEEKKEDENKFNQGQEENKEDENKSIQKQEENKEDENKSIQKQEENKENKNKSIQGQEEKKEDENKSIQKQEENKEDENKFNQGQEENKEDENKFNQGQEENKEDKIISLSNNNKDSEKYDNQLFKIKNMGNFVYCQNSMHMFLIEGEPLKKNIIILKLILLDAIIFLLFLNNFMICLVDFIHID